MIFSENAVLCDERGVLSSLGNVQTKNDLCLRFLRSLYGDKGDFLDFCANTDRSNYRFYRLRCFSADDRFRYAFCEKANILGERLTAVYLSRNAANFYPLMSPSSVNISTDASELVGINYSAHTGQTSVSASTFPIIERIPRLAEAIFSKTASARYCDITKITEEAVKRITSSVIFGAELKLLQEEKESSGDIYSEICNFPPEAYSAIFTLLCNILASVSSNHRLEIRHSRFAYAADVDIITESTKLTEPTLLSGIGYLSSAGVRKDLLETAEVLAYISGIDLSARYSCENRQLIVTIGVGYDIPPIPDFKYSNPLENIAAVVEEVGTLVNGLL